jgi:hypothetical protein
VKARAAHVNGFHRAVPALPFGSKPALTVAAVRAYCSIELKLPLPTIAYIGRRS